MILVIWRTWDMFRSVEIFFDQHIGYEPFPFRHPKIILSKWSDVIDITRWLANKMTFRNLWCHPSCNIRCHWKIVSWFILLSPAVPYEIMNASHLKEVAYFRWTRKLNFFGVSSLESSWELVWKNIWNEDTRNQSTRICQSQNLIFKASNTGDNML